MWQKMTALAAKNGWKGGNFKNLNLPFEPLLLSQAREVRERMCNGVEEFVFKMLTEVFHAEGTASLAKEAILRAGSYDLGPKGQRLEDPAQWTKEKIVAKAKTLVGDKGPEGDFDD
jgi:fructose-bisphosphate aldolase class II